MAGAHPAAGIPMDYFTILNLNREPFSNSPDPDYFFQSQQHWDCLQKLELSLHLRRGLNVVIGEVGSGKTTLCRQLIRKFAARKEMETHLILDPGFRDSGDFLATVAKLLTGRRPAEGASDWQVKEFIKHSLFRKGVDQKKTVVLIIDEGQKLPEFCLEILREFLNYETNEYKLLQIVIFAQKEFEEAVARHPNFGDRIHLFHRLEPLSFRDTRRMIHFRLEKSSRTPSAQKLFTLPALWAVYRKSGGYPRKIVHLCHHSVLAMIIQNSRRITYRTVRRCAARLFPVQAAARRRLRFAAGVAAAAAIACAAAIAAVSWRDLLPRADRDGRSAAEEPAAVPAPDGAPGERGPLVPAAATSPEPTAPAPREAANDTVSPPQTEIVKPARTEAVEGHPPEPAALAASPLPAPAEGSAVELRGAVPRPPTTLGRVALRPNETLSGLMNRVYGGFTSRHFRAVILANPHIEDPDRVAAGGPVLLPAVSVPVKALNKDAWWVKIADAGTLEEGVDFLRNYPESTPLRLVPYWTPQRGLRFTVVLKQLFKSEPEARARLERLPTPYAETGGLINAWGEEAVFFSDPYFTR